MTPEKEAAFAAVQAEPYARVVELMLQANTMPLMTMLEQWFHHTPDARRQQLTGALVERLLVIIQGGALDHELEAFLRADPASNLLPQLGNAITTDHDGAIRRAVAERVSAALLRDDEMKKFMRDYLVAEARHAVKAELEEQAPLVTEQVRAQFPEVKDRVAEVEKRLVQQSTNQITRRLKKEFAQSLDEEQG